MDVIRETLQPHFNFWIYVILMMIGLWALIAKNNLIKKLMGMAIFQTAIILLYVSLGVKEGATIPIYEHKSEAQYATEVEAYEAAKAEMKGQAKAGEAPKKPSHYAKPKADTMANPLPHVLMLTAIVVGVATLGVALAIAQMIFKEFGSLEEDEILKEIKAGNVDD